METTGSLKHSDNDRRMLENSWLLAPNSRISGAQFTHEDGQKTGWKARAL